MSRAGLLQQNSCRADSHWEHDETTKSIGKSQWRRTDKEIVSIRAQHVARKTIGGGQNIEISQGKKFQCRGGDGRTFTVTLTDDSGTYEVTQN